MWGPGGGCVAEVLECGGGGWGTQVIFLKGAQFGVSRGWSAWVLLGPASLVCVLPSPWPASALLLAFGSLERERGPKRPR